MSRDHIVSQRKRPHRRNLAGIPVVRSYALVAGLKSPASARPCGQKTAITVQTRVQHFCTSVFRTGTDTGNLRAGSNPPNLGVDMSAEYIPIKNKMPSGPDDRSMNERHKT